MTVLLPITAWSKRVVKSLHIINIDNNLIEPAHERFKQRYRVIFKTKLLWDRYISFTQVPTIVRYFS